ncbi:unnamed protein product [Soboliphyme baturini]|uniref:Uncharacterized protein n=1 Tax=Soboliphyme baturini TaxID=241478 RepID=A0A183J2B5_9BILA|nr:unnamed protein product [Soboliphyme baturini]
MFVVCRYGSVITVPLQCAERCSIRLWNGARFKLSVITVVFRFVRQFFTFDNASSFMSLSSEHLPRSIFADYLPAKPQFRAKHEQGSSIEQRLPDGRFHARINTGPVDDVPCLINGVKHVFTCRSLKSP